MKLPTPSEYAAIGRRVERENASSLDAAALWELCEQAKTAAELALPHLQWATTHGDRCDEAIAAVAALLESLTTESLGGTDG